MYDKTAGRTEKVKGCIHTALCYHIFWPGVPLHLHEYNTRYKLIERSA